MLLRNLIRQQNVHWSRQLTIVRSVKEMREIRRMNGLKSIGYVPTMGALHEGHLRLMQLAKDENELCVSSIFVNPTQFSPGEDYERYPRDLDTDISKLKSIEVDYVFAPDSKEIYTNDRLCHVEPLAFNQLHEGRARPEFFRGVATIVCKLFNIVQPTTAYFGQKDVSQCILVRKMVEDLNIPVKIRIIETIRDKDGLAMSSRNSYLSTSERKVANVLYQGLNVGKSMIEEASSGIDATVVIKQIEKEIMKEPMVKSIDYISIASYINMKELDFVTSSSTGAVISSAIRLGNVRLIDNLLVGKANDLLI